MLIAAARKLTRTPFPANVRVADNPLGTQSEYQRAPIYRRQRL